MRRFIFSALAIVGLICSKYTEAHHQQQGNRDIRAQNVDPKLTKEKAWAIKESLIQSVENENITDVCQTALKNFTMDLLRGKPYAVKAWDSQGKLQSGMKTGALLWSGQYSECIGIDEKYFEGKWCLVSYGEQYKIFADFALLGRSVGICLPSTCTDEYLNKKIALISNTSGTTMAINCPEQPTEWSATDILSLCIIVILATLCIAGTILEVVSMCETCDDDDEALLEPIEGGLLPATNQDPHFESKWLRALFAFSVINNTRILFGSYRKDNTLNCLHGIRFISMTWIILGHVYSIAFLVPEYTMRNSGTFARVMLSSPSYQAMANASHAVYTFFLISGILVAYNSLKRLNFEHPGRKILAMYCRRYIRLTPPYALIIIILVGVYSKFGSGPFWPEFYSWQKQACQKYWWSHLLYISNFYPEKASDACFRPGWYLATDFQLFLIAPLFILLLRKKPRIGLSVMLVSIVASTGIVLILALVYDTQPIPISLGIQFNEIIRVLTEGNTTSINIAQLFPSEHIGNDFNRKPWIQFPVYIIGMVIGHMLHESNGKPKINKIVCAVGWMIALASMGAVVYGLYPHMTAGSKLPIGARAFYQALHKPVWAISVSWVIITCASGSTGPVNKFLSCRCFVPLSKLTFGMYLVHSLIISWFYSSLETPIQYSPEKFMIVYLGVLMLSIGGSYLLWVVAEAPFLNIMKVLYPVKTTSEISALVKDTESVTT